MDLPEMASEGSTDNELQIELHFAREAGETLQAVRALHRLGLRAALRREYRFAVSLLAEAVDIWKRLTESEQEPELGSSLYTNWGIYQSEVGELDAAADTLRVALSLCDRAGADGRAASVLGALAFIAHTRGRYGDALRYIERQLERERRPGVRVSKANKAITYNNYAALLSDIGETGRALHFYREAYRRHRELGDTERALIALINEATLHDDEGRRAMAEQTYDRARNEANLAGAVAIEAAALNHLGLLLIDSPERREAGEAAIREALAISQTAGDALSVAVCKLNLARAVRADDPAAAERLLRQAADEFAALEVRDGQVQALADLAELLRVADSSAAADMAAEQAIALIESGRAELDRAQVPGRFAELQRSFFAERLDIYDEHCLALARRALAAEEPSKGAELLGRAFVIAERRRARELSQLLAKVDKVPPPSVPTIPEARAILDKQTAILAFVTAREAGVCFAMTADNLSAFVLPSQARLKRWIDGLRTWCDTESHPPAMFAGDLSAAVLSGPLTLFADLGLTIDRLLVIPDRPLHALPFACLPVGSDEETSFLVDAYELELSPSLTVALQLEQRRASSQAAHGFIGFGSASIPTASETCSTPPLAGTGAELEAITQLMHAAGIDPVETLTGESCTKKAAIGRLERPGAGWAYVHFATHGLLDLGVPEMSGLLLSAEAGEDPYWRAADIAARRMPSNLVVTSACETVRGKNVAGEGALGIARAFLVAGAASVCASLWEVPDDATSLLMGHLYTRLTNHELPAQALRSAQRAVRSEGFDHPVNWAGLEVIR